MRSNTATRLLSRLPSWLAAWPESAASSADRANATAERRADREVRTRLARARFHLGRGRRARERARFADGAREARRAIERNPGDPWAYALLSQCLLRQAGRQAGTDLSSARLAAERACALSPTNGYFVGVLLDVLDAQGDRPAREDALAWAWWSGAPVERWLGPDARPAPPRPGPIPARVVESDGAAAEPAPAQISGGGIAARGALRARGVTA
jgi:hypothetical protein